MVQKTVRLTSSFLLMLNSVRLLQTTQIKQVVSFTAANKVYKAQIKLQSFESRRNFFLFFLPGVDASHVYVRTLALGCFYSHISTGTFRRALTASLDSCAEIECPISGVTKSGKVWRKVPESDARSVGTDHTPAKHRFPAPKFLQTLPDLVTSLKGHSLSPRSCPPTRSVPSERFGWYECGIYLAPMHPRKHETHPLPDTPLSPHRFNRPFP